MAGSGTCTGHATVHVAALAAVLLFLAYALNSQGMILTQETQIICTVSTIVWIALCLLRVVTCLPCRQRSNQQLQTVLPASGTDVSGSPALQAVPASTTQGLHLQYMAVVGAQPVLAVPVQAVLAQGAQGTVQQQKL
jgi:hypothetical protein